MKDRPRKEYRGVPFDPTAALGHSGANIAPQNQGEQRKCTVVFITVVVDFVVVDFVVVVVDFVVSNQIRSLLGDSTILADLIRN